jgi:hypothetical protein
MLTIAHELDVVSYTKDLRLVLQWSVRGSVPDDLHHKIEISAFQF